MRKTITLNFVVIFFSFSFFYLGCSEEETQLRIQGEVSDIVDGTPIVGAKVELWKMGFGDSGGLLDEARSDQQGNYGLFYIQEDYCPESLFNLVASATGFNSVSYTTLSVINDSTATPVRCTEKLQKINFQLEKM